MVHNVQSRQILAEVVYEPVTLQRGYANRSIRIDVSKNLIEIKPVTQEMKDLWLGGKGFDLWLMFQEINPNTKWDSPENTISMSSGPLGGTTSFPGSGKTLVTAISPLTSSVIDCNVGGYFGPYLKFAGFDALCIVGKASEEVIVYIDSINHKITIEKAPDGSHDSHLISEEFTERFADNEIDKRNIAVVSTGRAAQYTRMGILNFSFWDWRRGVARLKQVGRGGIGTVFADKKIRALVIKNSEIVRPWKVAESKVAHEFTSQIYKSPEGIDREQVRLIIQKWNADPDYVIEMMQDVQNCQRYISQEAIEEISLRTGVTKGQLYHIATFYKAFSLKPRGETAIEVCFGNACHVKGAPKIMAAFEKELGIKKGDTTKDNKFSLEAVACIGCCSIAPAIKVGEEVIGNVQPKDVPKIIQECLKKTKKN